MMAMGAMELVILMPFMFSSGIPLGVPPAGDDPLLAKIAPEECMFYVSWAGMKKPEASSDNHTERLLAEPEMQYFVAELEKFIGRMIEKNTAEGDVFGQTMARLAPTYGKKLLTSPTAIYLSDFQVKPGPAPPKIRGGMLINLGSDAAGLRLQVMLLAKQALGDKAKEIRVGELSLLQFRPDDDAPMFSFGFHDTYFILTLGEDAPAELSRNMASGTPAWLKGIRNELSIPRSSSLAHVDIAKILETIRGSIRDREKEDFDRIMPALGFANLKALAVHCGLDEKGFKQRVRLGFDGEPRGLFRMLEGRPLGPADVQPIPHDSTIALALRLSPTRVYDVIKEVVFRIEPREADDFERGVERAEEQLGFKLRDELLASVGDSWTVFNSPSEGGLLFTGLTATVDVKDHATLTRVAEKLVKLAKDEYDEAKDRRDGRRPRSAMQPKQEEFAGRTIHYFVGYEFPFLSAFCVTEDRLILALSPQNVRAVLSRSADFKSLAERPQIAGRLSGPTAPLMISYSDDRELMRMIYPLIQGGASMLATQAQREGIDLNLGMLPSLAAFDRHVQPSVSVLRRDMFGLHMEAETTIPTSAAGGLFPMLMPMWLVGAAGPIGVDVGPPAAVEEAAPRPAIEKKAVPIRPKGRAIPREEGIKLPEEEEELTPEDPEDLGIEDLSVPGTVIPDVVPVPARAKPRVEKDAVEEPLAP